jgi:hypothetical protein
MQMNLVELTRPLPPFHLKTARVLTSHSGHPWAMRLRPAALIRDWAEEAGFAVETVTMERRGIFGVLVARRA